MKTKLILIMAAALVAGCVNYENMAADERTAWLGRSEMELLGDKGVPNKTMPRPDGGKIYVYDRSGTVTLPGQAQTTTSPGLLNGTTTSSTTYTAPTDIRIARVWEYWINSKGKVDSVMLHHN